MQEVIKASELSGAEELPAGSIISFPLGNGEFYKQKICDSGNNLDFSGSLLQGVFLEMVQSSLFHPHASFVESGCILSSLNNGGVEQIVLNSESANGITWGIHMEKIPRSQIFKQVVETGAANFIWHIHTHPGPELREEDKKNDSILINDEDYRAYQQLSALFSYCSANDISITGVVLPIGENCGNVYFQTPPVAPLDTDDIIWERAHIAGLPIHPRWNWKEKPVLPEAYTPPVYE